MSKQAGPLHELVALSPSPRFMPPDWKPPAPAWSASFAQQATPVVMAYFGIQLRSADASPDELKIHRFFESPDAPANVETATYVDRAGYRTFLSSAYWTDPARYASWQKNSGFAAWWADPVRRSDPEGYFREILTVAPDRFETIFTYDCLVGVAKTGGCPVVGPIREHNYWGSMRDRIAASAHDDLRSSYNDRLPRLGSTATAGNRLRLAVPENLAVIRSGQDWTNCAGSELVQYDESVRPALLEGMNFLRDHPDETGCCDLRFAEETERHGSPLKKSIGLGYFLTLGHLEKWASTHPTHLAIFSKFLTMVREHGSDLKLKLWHEVSVLPAGDQLFEYINCHPETGLLPYFPSTEVEG
jgi:aliphatic aldoxime dehydratase